MKLSEKLIELRKEKGWSQEEFAEKLDVSRQAISRWENGTALPDAQNILRISKLFHITADYLLNDDSPSDRSISTPETTAGDQTTQKHQKNASHWWIIPSVCFLILAVCVIVKIVRTPTEPTDDAHIHSVFTSIKENEVAPTCAAEGSYDVVVYCTECDEEILRTSQSIAKLSHKLSNMIRKNEVAPTCTAKGSYDEIVYCTKCGEELFREHKSTEMIAHQFQNRKCTVCNTDQPSEGLFYMSNGDGTCTMDIGNCADENIVIPEYSPSGDRVTQIKAGAFAYNHTVKSIQIPETVTFIGENAFQGCTNLESINLPSKITRIHSYTFQGCKSLKNVTIPKNVYFIGVEAFAECYAMESIVIPASVEKIGKFAFRNFAGGDGTVIFEIYYGWKVYDDSENCVATVDFQSHIFTPTDTITYRYCDLAWKRQ